MSIEASFPTIKPTLNLDFANTQELDPRITFTRASTATYYDGETFALAEQNLLRHSQGFNNATYWANANRVTADATTAPDGTTTADLLLEWDTAVVDFNVSQASGGGATTGTHTISVYVKAAGRNYVCLWELQSLQGKYFDVSAGGTGSVLGNYFTAPSAASITYVGNDWYRCTITVTVASGTPRAYIYISDNGTRVTYAGDITKGLYLWGAQLEQRSSVTAYTPTTTAPITNYIPVLLTAPAGRARFDHNPTTGESLGLLIEEQRTNVITYSEDFSNAIWVKGASSVSADAMIAPSGSQTADKLVEDTTLARHTATNTFIAAAAGNYTASVYCKAAGRNYACLGFSTDSDSKRYSVVVDLLSGAITATNQTGSPIVVSSSVTNCSNGWFRITTTLTNTAGAVYFTVAISNSATPSYLGVLPAYQGNGFDGIYIWGAQLEAGAFATSYIATTSSQVTRSADNAVMTGTNFSQWYNPMESTMYVDGTFNSPPQSGQENFYALIGPSYTNFGITQRRNTTTSRIYDVYSNNNVYVGGTSATVGANATTFKEAIAFNTTSAQATINGVVGSLVSGAITTGNATKLSIGQYFFSFTMNGTIKKIAYYPARLTNAQLQALTS